MKGRRINRGILKVPNTNIFSLNFLHNNYNNKIKLLKKCVSPDLKKIIS